MHIVKKLRFSLINLVTLSILDLRILWGCGKMVNRILYALFHRGDAWRISTWDQLFIENGSFCFDRDPKMFIKLQINVLETWK